MGRFSCLKVGLLALGLLVLPGCGAKLKYSKTITVSGNGTERIFFDDPKVDKATITIKSPGVPVNAFLVLQSNEDAANKAIDEGKAPKDVLAGAEKVEEKSFDILPGKKPFALFLTSTGKKAEVAVTATGK